MDRRSFFKGIGIISAGIVVAPVVTSEALKEPLCFVYQGENVKAYIKNGITQSLNTPEEILKLWKETGILVFKPYKPSSGTLTKRIFDKHGVTFIEAKND